MADARRARTRINPVVTLFAETDPPGAPVKGALVRPMVRCRPAFLGKRMRFVLLISAALTGSGLVMARVSEKPASAPQVAAIATPQAAALQTSGSRRTQIPADRAGHFVVEGAVEGRRAEFLIDTGASIVALTEKDADRLGVRLSARDPKVFLQTANGKVTGTRVRLASIDIGDVRVQDVDAVVLPDHALKQNLLGMTFLSRISRYEFRSGQLLLEQ